MEGKRDDLPSGHPLPLRDQKTRWVEFSLMSDSSAEPFKGNGSTLLHFFPRKLISKNLALSAALTIPLNLPGLGLSSDFQKSLSCRQFHP